MPSPPEGAPAPAANPAGPPAGDNATPATLPSVAPLGAFAPAHTVSSPEQVSWHMIQDHELTQLASLQTGIVASLGFVGMGGIIGLLGPCLTAADRITKVSTAPLQPPLGVADLWYIGGFWGSVVVAVVCLGISFFNWRANGTLADRIRKRPKHGLQSST